MQPRARQIVEFFGKGLLLQRSTCATKSLTRSSRTLRTSWSATNNWSCAGMFSTLKQEPLRTCDSHPLSPCSSPLKTKFCATSFPSQNTGQSHIDHFSAGFHNSDIAPFLIAPLSLFPSLYPNPRLVNAPSCPMSSRIIFERLSCPSNAPPQPSDDHAAKWLFDYLKFPETGPEPARTALRQTTDFICMNTNDGIITLPICTPPLRSSCPLDEVLAQVKRGEQIGVYGEICGLGKDVGDRITLWISERCLRWRFHGRRRGWSCRYPSI